METRVGISGWRYVPWRGVFYPDKLIQKKELFYASRQVGSIEINGSFYANQSPASYKRWYDETPDDFVFSVKGPRFITHVRRLKDSQTPLANFFASGVLHLKKKLGPFLWQLPPSSQFHDDRIEDFFKLLPKSFAEAIQLTQSADRLEPDYPEGFSRLKLRHAIEVRNHSFENPDFIDLLRKYNVALVFADTAGRWPYMEDVTSDFVYLRLHGNEELYVSGYSDEAIKFWARRIRAWQNGREPSGAITLTDEKPAKISRDAFVYFDNDIKVHAPDNARSLMRLLKVKA